MLVVWWNLASSELCFRIHEKVEWRCFYFVLPTALKWVRLQDAFNPLLKTRWGPLPTGNPKHTGSSVNYKKNGPTLVSKLNFHNFTARVAFSSAFSSEQNKACCELHRIIRPLNDIVISNYGWWILRTYNKPQTNQICNTSDGNAFDVPDYSRPVPEDPTQSPIVPCQTTESKLHAHGKTAKYIEEQVTKRIDRVDCNRTFNKVISVLMQDDDSHD